MCFYIWVWGYIKGGNMNKIIVVLLLIIVVIGCNYYPRQITATIDNYSTSDTNSDGIKNQLYYEAEIKNLSKQSVYDVNVDIIAVYSNDSEIIYSYLGNMYGGDSTIIKRYHEIGAKDLKDVITKERK